MPKLRVKQLGTKIDGCFDMVGDVLVFLLLQILNAHDRSGKAKKSGRDKSTTMFTIKNENVRKSEY